MIRQLQKGEIVRAGDLVTVGEDASRGYRPLQGVVGIPAGEYFYPLFREVPDRFEAGPFVRCTFTDNEGGGGAVEIDLNTNSPDDNYCPPQSVYGAHNIRKLAEWLMECAKVAEDMV